MARKRGRPKAANPKNQMLRVRTTAEEYAKVERLAQERGITMSDALREALLLRLCAPTLETVSMRFDALVAAALRGAFNDLDSDVVRCLQDGLEEVVALIQVDRILETQGKSLDEALKILRELTVLVGDRLTEQDFIDGAKHTREVANGID